MNHTYEVMTEQTLFDLGVQDGTNAALFDADIIGTHEFHERYGRSRTIIAGESREFRNTWDPKGYWSGYNAAYANTKRPEVLAVFTRQVNDR